MRAKIVIKGIRLGNWLSVKEAQTLLNTPDVTTTKGLRDRAILAVLLGCGLRRSEVAALTMGHVQQRDGRWCIVDLVGKNGRVRTIPMPTWVKVAQDAWTKLGRGIAPESILSADGRSVGLPQRRNGRVPAPPWGEAGTGIAQRSPRSSSPYSSAPYYPDLRGHRKHTLLSRSGTRGPGKVG
jgi:hypothetical protein